MFKFSDYLGDTAPSPIFLPEVGTFFNQDKQLAHELIDRLIGYGVECLKGEILHSADLALDIEFETAYYDKSSKTYKKENYRQLIERKIMSFEQYENLFSYPREKGIQLVFSVYDLDGADFAISIGAKALKVASSNLVHQPLIEYLAQKGIPTIIDTGKAHFFEIARAVEWYRNAGGKDLLLEHSPLAPPAPASEQYLSMLPILRDTFHCPVGLSDHYDGNDMLLASVPLGAAILEKGVILPSMQGEQDSAHAMLIDEVPQVMHQIQVLYEACHRGMRPPPSATHAARMGLVAKQILQEGDVISLDTATFAWPALGIPVELWSQVVGKRVGKKIAARQPITLGCLD
ncbi:MULTISPECIES: N-acetylneuraminate synthase family protein [Thiomicrorhabdus]|uniref:N-acetylneuraminate synthase family protein n=1 Tax=Thiomicrorhabdus heinhorstiae TaxID=2748010 RepID=A0ABS0C306_9GAMM|nr:MULTISPECIES: N-acetylneuraminate synthase family protein [Thiomicrorhabdus]MBF6058667.1 N-acetylneuraminate synthase family protein [Thiomicrorhabdus heinhorstiae]